ncbi:MAG: SocA family protein [Endomicrobium sp.]|uniref:Panacea domain-containing protein n=1 Tax=Candidatus Endomicrobiellum pyrsonymphae TaxID=1408203 RepID=UPI00357D1A97|nr:SocA family protein [Endomicrobium sp.]
MNFKKLVQVVNYVLAKYDYRLNYTKLIKLLYISDRECLNKWNFAISGDSYVSMKQGPVLSGLYNLILENSSRCAPTELAEWKCCFYQEDNDLISKIEYKCSYGELCDAETDILDSVDKKYHTRKYGYLIKEVHKFPEWNKDAEKYNTSYSLPKQSILRSLNKSEKEIKAIIDNEQTLSQLDESFKEKGLMI